MCGHPFNVRSDRAGTHGYGPCRSCLRRFREGEQRLLFPFNPFTSRFGDYAGPVFIHEEECDPFDSNGFPPELRDVPLLMRAYDSQFGLVGDALPEPASIEADVDRLLADERTASQHIRNHNAKCFVARIVPAALWDPPEVEGMARLSPC